MSSKNLDIPTSSVDELLPDVKAACQEFLRRCTAAGLKVKIVETYRSQERQNWIYASGRTRPGDIRTKTQQSKHTQRRAWDICQNIPRKEYAPEFMREAAEIGRSMGINCGYYWNKFQDPPHYQVDKGAKIIFENKESKEGNIMLKEWQKKGAEECLQKLYEEKIIKNPEMHLMNLAEVMPQWLFWMVIWNFVDWVRKKN